MPHPVPSTRSNTIGTGVTFSDVLIPVWYINCNILNSNMHAHTCFVAWRFLRRLIIACTRLILLHCARNKMLMHTHVAIIVLLSSFLCVGNNWWNKEKHYSSTLTTLSPKWNVPMLPLTSCEECYCVSLSRSLYSPCKKLCTPDEPLPVLRPHCQPLLLLSFVSFPFQHTCLVALVNVTNESSATCNSLLKQPPILCINKLITHTNVSVQCYILWHVRSQLPWHVRK